MGVTVGVSVAVGVTVGVSVAVGVTVGVSVCVGVKVGRGVAVDLGVDLGCGYSGAGQGGRSGGRRCEGGQSGREGGRGYSRGSTPRRAARCGQQAEQQQTEGTQGAPPPAGGRADRHSPVPRWVRRQGDSCAL